MEKFIFVQWTFPAPSPLQRYAEGKQMDTTEIELLKITKTNEDKSKEVKLFVALRG